MPKSPRKIYDAPTYELDVETKSKKMKSSTLPWCIRVSKAKFFFWLSSSAMLLSVASEVRHDLLEPVGIEP